MRLLKYVYRNNIVSWVWFRVVLGEKCVGVLVGWGLLRPTDGYSEAHLLLCLVFCSYSPFLKKVDMVEPWKHYSRCKMDTKGHMIYGSVYMKCPDRSIVRVRTWFSGWLGLGEEQVGKWLLIGMGFLFGWWKCSGIT